MDASQLVSRRTLIAAALAAGPVSGAVWHFLSSASQGQSAATGTGNSPVVVPTDTWNPMVRVNLTPEPVQSVTVSISGPFRVLAPGSPEILLHGDAINQLTVSVDGAGFRFGGDLIPISQMEIVAAKSPSIWVGRSQYRGSVRIYRQPNNRLIAVNVLPMEEYLASVVNSEMPASFPAAARQAQAIIARTYVLAHMKGHPRFDVFATSRSQKYLGYQYLDDDDDSKRLAGESANSREITRATAGIVCTYQGKVFTTYYTAVCGGRTVNGRSVFTDAVPPIRSVTCDWCRDSDRYRWSTATNIAEATRLIKEQLATDSRKFGTLRSISIDAVPEGDLPYYLVNDENGSTRIAGTILRRVLPYGVLWSPHFSARVTGSEIQFSGRGHGHGVGFCQWGSRGLGLAGRSAVEILRYYYPGAAIVRLKSQ